VVGAYDTRAGPAGVQLCMYSSVTDYCSVFGRSAYVRLQSTMYTSDVFAFYSTVSLLSKKCSRARTCSSLGTHYADYGSYAQYGKELLPAQSCAHTSMLNVLVAYSARSDTVYRTLKQTVHNSIVTIMIVLVNQGY
jgi:hypothetical protein